MLKALYDYAVRENLVLPPGFVLKQIKAYICLAENGTYLGIEDGGSEPVPCPDIGSLANGTDKCNVFAEKCSVVLAPPENKKTLFFRKVLRDGADIPALAVCLNALEDAETFSMIKSDADKRKLKGLDRITFRVGMTDVVELPEVRDWWASYRKLLIPTDTESRTRCLITGSMTTPLTTVPPIRGLQRVGGHGKGDALICFDKPSFQSYGLKQSANAPVSEEAFAGVKAALDNLLSDAPVIDIQKKQKKHEKMPVCAGMRIVHWYDKDISSEQDLFDKFFNPDNETDDEDNIDAAEEIYDEDIEEEELSERRAKAKAEADDMINSIKTGSVSPPLDAVYYIIFLTGVNGRVMVRRYSHGTYAELQQNLDLWNNDLKLTDTYGTGCLKNQKFITRQLRLISYQKSDRKPFERLDKELSGITPAIIMAVLTAAPLPDNVAARSMAYIQSKMFDDNDDNAAVLPDGIACQWLKVWLNRKKRYDKKEELLVGVYYNENHPEPAYHCGALMAVYAAIQNIAMPDVNSSVVQRYYSAACRTPALVLTRLDELANYHLEKITSNMLRRNYEEHISRLYAAIGDEIPTVLDMEKQAYFVLGYRQYAAILTKEKNEYTAKKAMAKKAGNMGQQSITEDLIEED